MLSGHILTDIFARLPRGASATSGPPPVSARSIFDATKRSREYHRTFSFSQNLALLDCFVGNWKFPPRNDPRICLHEDKFFPVCRDEPALQAEASDPGTLDLS